MEAYRSEEIRIGEVGHKTFREGPQAAESCESLCSHDNILRSQSRIAVSGHKIEVLLEILVDPQSAEQFISFLI